MVFPRVDPVGPVPGAACRTRGRRRGRGPRGRARRRRGRQPRRARRPRGCRTAGYRHSIRPPRSASWPSCSPASDATTWFCWVQHQTPLRTLEGDVAGLVTGAPVRPGGRAAARPAVRADAGAVAFAHVRRPGPANPVATRVRRGLATRRDAGLGDVVGHRGRRHGHGAGRRARMPAGSSAATCRPAGPAGRRRACEPGPALDLLPCRARTRAPCAWTGCTCRMPGWGRSSTGPRGWRQDAVRTADANPSAFGVARGAIAELHDLAERRADEGMAELVHALVQECRTVRAAVPTPPATPERAGPDRLALRAASLDLAARAAMAVVIGPLGGGDARGCSAERRLREAMFLQVQAQTAATRQASLELMRTRAWAASRRTVTYGPMACAHLSPAFGPPSSRCDRCAPVRNAASARPSTGTTSRSRR